MVQEITCPHRTWLVQSFDIVTSDKDEIPNKGLVSDHVCEVLHVYRNHKALKRIYYRKIQESTSIEIGEVQGVTSIADNEPPILTVDNDTEVWGGVYGDSEIEITSVGENNGS